MIGLTMDNISRVLVANRGEIAVRIIKACQDLGLETVAALSEVDLKSMPAKLADRVICIGPSYPSKSYLNIGAIISAALGTLSDAIHPGYGFLAEQPELPEICEKNNLIFIGPQSEKIRQMGNKLLARKIVHNLGINVIPGSEKVNNFNDAIQVSEGIGFPVLLKAAAGGGGRGMRVAMSPVELKTAFESAAAEAHAAFGDETIYVEKYIPNARHIEVQILADCFGNVVHLGERDCSLQRRYQKIIEEAPAPSLAPELREEICKAGVSIAKNISYENAGTVEFILDQDTQKFYFLEMNTRVQVEHPVTEMITGIDIVQEQIKIAARYPLSISQSDVQFSGHAIECRINAESPTEGFQPKPGRIIDWLPPQDKGVRVDTHCYGGYSIPPYYDSLMAKIITTGSNRLAAVNKMQSSLHKFIVSGVDTTIPFLQFLINEKDYFEGRINTRWVEKALPKF